MSLLWQSADEPRRRADKARPRARASPGRAGSASASSGRPRHVVLIVDDVADARLIYAAFFESRGYGALTAPDGYGAIRRAIEDRPDVIVMDYSLPGLNGAEATRRLKADPRTRDIPVIVLTAHFDRAIDAGSLEAGADAFLTKPCLPDELEEHVRRLVDGRRSERP
jgi:two-component system cell cycle response regulator DivK